MHFLILLNGQIPKSESNLRPQSELSTHFLKFEMQMTAWKWRKIFLKRVLDLPQAVHLDLNLILISVYVLRRPFQNWKKALIDWRIG